MYKTSFSILLSLIIMFATFVPSALAQERPTLSGKVCFEFNDFNDYLSLQIYPGLPLVTAVYRACSSGGGVPNPGSVDALMVGTKSPVALSSTVPQAPFFSTGEQISLIGTMASGNFDFGGGDEDKVSQCYAHVLFTDNTNYQEGKVVAACGWFDSSNPDLDLNDKFVGDITRIPCRDVEELNGGQDICDAP